jgi:hypothetical protein
METLDWVLAGCFYYLSYHKMTAICLHLIRVLPMVPFVLFRLFLPEILAPVIIIIA